MQLTDKQSVLQLIVLAREHGVKHVVLCPGSRNASIVHAFVAAGTFVCHSMVDERSAGFFALGLAQKTGTPVAVCVTSGTAAVNLHPAVAEAFYQEIPLVVISADRPRAWIGQQDGQTLPQQNIFGNLVKCAVDLPECNDEQSTWHCNRLINEALLACTFRGNGPVQINVPLSEPLFNFAETTFPQVRVIRRSRENKSVKNFSRRMMVCGQSVPAGMQNALDLPGFVCLAEHLSNGRLANAIGDFDEILATASEEEKRALAPDLLITIGGHIVSKRLKQFLRAFPPREHWHISADGKIADTFCCLTAALEGVPEKILADAFDVPANEFVNCWKNFSQRVPTTCADNLESQAVKALMSACENQNLYLANSSSVRLAQQFECRAKTVFCNRGTSGIEGTLSAALGGNALDDGALDCVLIGDLSFFYDMNALCAGTLNARLRILLLNNNGGKIFEKVPGVPVNSDAGKFITAQNNLSAETWARSRGFDYFAVKTATELIPAMQIFANPQNENPVFIELFA